MEVGCRFRQVLLFLTPYTMKTKDSYYIVHSWMIEDLGLSKTDLIVFAIIYGFSHDDNSSFHGSVDYLIRMTGAARSTLFRSINRLLESGLILKVDTETASTGLSAYRCDHDKIDSVRFPDRASPIIGLPQSKNETGTSPIIGLYYIKDINNSLVPTKSRDLLISKNLSFKTEKKGPGDFFKLADITLVGVANAADITLTDYQKTAIWCWECIRRNFPAHKSVLNAKLNEWAEVIRKMYEVDKITKEDFISVFWWAMNDRQEPRTGSTWRGWYEQIRSVDKFRKKYDDLLIKSKADREEKKPQVYSRNR